MENGETESTTKANKTTVGLAPATYQRGFGQEADSSVKYKMIQLVASVRTVMRGMSPPATQALCFPPPHLLPPTENRMLTDGWLAALQYP
jgi:hypothetical protein